MYTTEVMHIRLDSGGGKDLDLKECSREQLEKEVRAYNQVYDAFVDIFAAHIVCIFGFCAYSLV